MPPIRSAISPASSGWRGSRRSRNSRRRLHPARHQIRYGIDGLIGLIPVVGDIITTAISLWLVREARALGAPWHVTARMLAMSRFMAWSASCRSRATPSTCMFRANMRNVRMLRRWLDKQPR